MRRAFYMLYLAMILTGYAGAAMLVTHAIETSFR